MKNWKKYRLSFFALKAMAIHIVTKRLLKKVCNHVE